MKLVVEEDNIRLDKYLSENTTYSRSLISKMIKDKYILVNNEAAKNSYLIKTNDVIDIKEGYKIETSLEGENIPINIVYEDDDLMVINKQSGLVVHPGNGNPNHTLVNALIYHNKSLSSCDATRPGIVHRIDKDTSGLMLVAKNNKTHELLADDLKNKRIKREYLALLVGEFPHEKATIDAPIGRDSNNPEMMTIQSKNSKHAITHLEVKTRYKGYTLVSLVLDTGRTHQIRVHMKYIGYPIYNDPVYTNKNATEFGQFLHSTKITFIHPISKKKLTFESEVPEEFQDFLCKLEIK